MSTIKVANIQAPGAERPAASLTADGDFILNCMNGGSVAGVRNVLRNIRFSVSSRPDLIVGDNYSSTFIADGWSYSPKSETKGTTEASLSYYENRRCAYILSEDHEQGFVLKQRVEDATTFNGKTVSLSLELGCSNAFDLEPAIRVDLGSGSTDSNTLVLSDQGAQTISPGTIRRVWWTFTLPSTEGLNVQEDSYLEVTFSATKPYNGKLYLCGAQLERGDTATPLEDRPLSLDKKLCERFIQVYALGELDSVVSCPFKTGAVEFHYPVMIALPTHMRAIPSIHTEKAVCGVAAASGDALERIPVLARPRTEDLIAIGGYPGANAEGVMAFGGELLLDSEL